MKLKKEMQKWKNSLYLSLALALFFYFSIFHEWANNFTINLHFCNHLYCMIFSIIFFGFAYFAWKKKKSYINMVLIVLVVGVIFMNMTYCDAEGNIFFTDQFFTKNESILVPFPPCFDTDSGRDYITFGSILSGADVDDLCMGTDKLRERYCDTELTYTSEDISCSAKYGALWYCTEGECREGEDELEECYDDCYNEVYDYCIDHTPGEGSDEYDFCMIAFEGDITACRAVCDGDGDGTETDCGDGVDNDGDGLIDCFDPDCDYAFEDGGCGDFDYSCEHNPTNPYPFCGGTCPTGSYCGDYAMDTSSWCVCIPEGEVSCVDSTGDGWCEDDYICVEDGGEYSCVFDFGDCVDSDGGIDYLVGGYSTEEHPIYGTMNYIEYCGWDKWDLNTIYEYYCLDGVATPIEINCETLGLCCIEPYPDPGYCGGCEF